jgi:hypothetical protein
VYASQSIYILTYIIVCFFLLLFSFFFIAWPSMSCSSSCSRLLRTAMYGGRILNSLEANPPPPPLFPPIVGPLDTSEEHGLHFLLGLLHPGLFKQGERASLGGEGSRPLASLIPAIPGRLEAFYGASGEPKFIPEGGSKANNKQYNDRIISWFNSLSGRMMCGPKAIQLCWLSSFQPYQADLKL